MGGVWRGVFGYLFLVLMVRVAGRRPGKQITPFEFVFVFFAGGLTLTSMVGDDRSLLNAVGLIASIALTHFLMVWARQHWPVFGRIADGTPLVLLEKGRWRPDTMRRMRLQHDDVMAAARDKGLERLDQIAYAFLERNGEISIIPAED
ncbi:MAG TPA: YetF domain-containing protein [Bryobacteraceae bacterium]|nr:YetF domain-containing protein [Bryobacteraceae bacterium]